MEEFTGGQGDYERRKERARRRESEQSRSGRDIGPLPPLPPGGAELVEQCRHNLRLFCESFFPALFYLEWSNDHLEAINTLEDVILHGGQFALAMPRGSGKTSLVIAAIIWAIVYGHRLFIVAIAATGPKAGDILDAIKAQVETNDKLAEHYPAACYPVRKLEGINNRTAGQILDGERTRITWTGKRLVFPTVAGAASSGVAVHAAGLLGAIRGLQHTRADGRTVRPDLTIPDDPQTDDSAKQPTQTKKRLNVIAKAVLGLAGPNEKIAAVCPCTVIEPDDLADTLLSRDKSPEWRGRKFKLLREMPTAEALKLWGQYREIRADSLREHEDIREATEFYRRNREAMDAGAVASWPQRFEEHHLSAIQYAMDKWAANEYSFWAEMQNEPRPAEEAGIETLRLADVTPRYDGSQRGELPEWCECITAFADVQQDLLPWMVVAWGKDLRGRVVDYGGWPEQSKRYYTLRDLSPTLREATGERTVEGAWEQGLEALAGHLFERWEGLVWFGVDANYEISKEIVYEAAKRHPRIMPFHGRYVGAASLPMDRWKKRRGEKAGYFCRTVKEPGSTPRVVLADINAWKSIVAKRLRGELESGISWFGTRPHEHEMLCDQLTAEYAVKVSGRGRRVDEWKNRPGRDNHLWDCLVGAAVGASLQGLQITGRIERPKRRAVRGSEVLGRRRRHG